MAEKFESLKVDWHQGMTYEEEQKFFKGFVKELKAREEKRGNSGLGSEPWQPVYDDIMVSYLTAHQRRECEDAGFTREETVKHAKDRVLDAVWYKSVNPDSQKRNLYKDKEHFDRACKEGNLPVYEMMKVVKGKCDSIHDVYEYDYPGWEDSQAKELRQSFRIGECETGKQALDIIKDNHYRVFFNTGATSAEIDNEYKEIMMPVNVKNSTTALSLTYAAAVIKQEANGVGMSKEDVAIRKADALAMQASFASEMSEKMPEILATFIERGNKPVYDAFKQTLDKTNNPDAARSAAVDCYLDTALKGEKPAAEKIASVCKNANGQSYYISADEKKESAFNAVFAAKAKQGGR